MVGRQQQICHALPLSTDFQIPTTNNTFIERGKTLCSLSQRNKFLPANLHSSCDIKLGALSRFAIRAIEFPIPLSSNHYVEAAKLPSPRFDRIKTKTRPGGTNTTRRHPNPRSKSNETNKEVVQTILNENKNTQKLHTMASRNLTAGLRASLRQPHPRPLHTPIQTRLASSFLQERPSPPRLPAEQQAEFERLQRAAEAQLHSHTQIEPTSSSPGSPLATSRHVTTPSSQTAAATTETKPPTPTAEGGRADSLVSLSGGIRKGAPPEFEGDKNPKTGEVGGPKNEPLRWGAQGDWSFNGRVTDF